MKKMKSLTAAAFIILLFTSCSFAQFDGSRTGNESQLIMSFKILNTTDNQMLTLEQGDIIDFEIVNESGKIDIVLQKDKETPVFTGKEIPTNSFTVEIPVSGKYKVSVTGHNAKGSVSVVKRDMNE